MNAPNTQQTSIGSYKIIEKIGDGGMGEVYAGVHTLLGRKAAIKTLLPRFTNDQTVVNRFFNEAKAATAIKHPGIVKIYDFGYQDDGSAYIAMEFLQGEPLDVRLKRMGKLPVRQALRLVGQMASALAAAHAHNIVHRDLKPPNVFIVPDPQVAGGERIKLLDFGIAKMLETDDPGAKQTRASDILGSPMYMAPEQITSSAKIDSRADLYSLGCILFEMVCGRPPFDGGGNGPMAVMAAHLDEMPPIPSSLQPELSQELDALILYLLAKDPAHRYQHATDVGSAIAAISGEQISFTTLPSVTSQITRTGATQPGHTSPSTVPLSPSGVPLSDSQILSQLGSQVGMSSVLTQSGTQMRTASARSRKKRGRLALVAGLVVLLAGGGVAFIMLKKSSDTPAADEAVATAEDTQEQVVEEDPEPEVPKTPPRPRLTFKKLVMDGDGGGDGDELGDGELEIITSDEPVVDTEALRNIDFSIGRVISGVILRDIIQTINIRAIPTPPKPKTKWRIRSVPSGAEIVAKSGETMGKTPSVVEFDRTPGYAETYTLRLAGYDSKSIKLSGDENYDATIKLVAKIPIRVRSKPKGAEIFDKKGTSLGVTPAEILLSQSDKPVELTLKLEGYEDLPVQITPDRKKKEKFKLIKERAMITIRIESDPSGAVVVKNGKELGETPLEDKFLEEKGKIKYVLRLDGYADRKLRVHADRDATETVKMKKCEDRKRRRVDVTSIGPKPIRVYDDPCEE